MSPFTYPATRRSPVTDDWFGQTIADPFRWLEAEAHTAPEIQDWIAAQNAVTEAHLASLPGRAVLLRG